MDSWRRAEKVSRREKNKYLKIREIMNAVHRIIKVREKNIIEIIWSFGEDEK